MTNLRVTILLGLLVASATEGAPPPPPLPLIKDDPACTLFNWPLSPQVATKVLKQTRIFTQTGVYRGGDPPPQVAAFNVLLDQADPIGFLDDVASNGTVAGRLYALCAFDLLDHHRRDALASVLQAAPDEVFTQFGCIGSYGASRLVAKTVIDNSYGKSFRDAKQRTYDYFGGPANICMQATVGGVPAAESP
jgi:hypothetical protein